jgi:hypothetical protein
MSTEDAGRKRWKSISKKERALIASKGGKSAWAKLTKEERSAEMKRRMQQSGCEAKSRSSGGGSTTSSIW